MKQYYDHTFSHHDRLNDVYCKFCDRKMQRTDYLAHVQRWHCSQAVRELEVDNAQSSSSEGEDDEEGEN